VQLRDGTAAASLTVRRPDSPPLVWILIAAILIGGMPLLSGIALTGDSKPAFTLDVCHPAGGAVSSNLSQTEAPLIPTHAGAQVPRESSAAPEPIAAFSPRPSEAPDPPPPKIGA
jgi:hypothetical protein